MLKFVKTAFRGFIDIILWVNLILCVIVGGVIGNALSGWGANYTFPGIIIGLLLGLLTNIVGGGFVATILNIDKNLEEQKNLLRQQMGLPITQPESEPHGEKSIAAILNTAINSAKNLSGNSSGNTSGSPSENTLESLSENPTEQSPRKKQCKRCKKIVDPEYTSCPYCSVKKSGV